MSGLGKSHETVQWRVPTSCRSNDWKVVHGRIPPVCRWAVGGPGTARRRGMKEKPHKPMFLRPSAISAMPPVVPGLRRSVPGTRCASRFRLHPAYLKRSDRILQPWNFPLPFTSAMSASGLISRSSTENWNITFASRSGRGVTMMIACRRWPSVSSKRIRESGLERKATLNRP